MREILFRGKRVDNGEWVFGYYTELPEGDIGGTLMAGTNELLCEDTADYIISIETKQCQSFSPAYPIQVFDVDWCKVRCQTVGQYTGLTDMNGKRIFEGDIVKLTDKSFGYKWKAIVEFGNPNGNYTWGWQLKPIGKAKNVNTDILCWVEMEETGAFCEIIGNIHDNPELLQEDKQ